MAFIRKRNSALLFKIEATEGTDASPTAGSDAIRVENLDYKPVVKTAQTNESSGSLDTAAPIAGGAYFEITGTIYFKGSGTAGTVPEFASLLKACGFAEAVVNSAIPAAPEACAAGGSTTLAVLGASASTTVQNYRGAPINFTGAVVGSSVIIDYTAAKSAALGSVQSAAIVATSNYQIPVHVRYTPTSTSIPSGTAYVYMDGLRARFVGCRGDLKLSLTANGTLKGDFTLRGMFVDKTDTAMPGGLSYQSTTKPIWKGGAMYLNAAQAAVASFSLTLGNKLTSPDDPNQSQGFGTAQITERNSTGTIDPLMTAVATRNSLADLLAGNQQSMFMQLGSSTGNRIALTMPLIQLSNYAAADREGLMVENLTFQNCVNDAGLIIAFF